MIRAHVLICGGTGCTSSGSASIQKAFEENLQALNAEKEQLEEEKTSLDWTKKQIREF